MRSDRCRPITPHGSMGANEPAKNNSRADSGLPIFCLRRTPLSLLPYAGCCLKHCRPS